MESSDIGHGLGPNLTKLDINDNNFNDTILASLSRLQNLQYLDVSDNSSPLQYLDLSYTYFHGELSADIDHNLSQNLTMLCLNHNNFSGTIPTMAFFRFWSSTDTSNESTIS
jgi:Leucine-rich repeat (LRR) protein